MKYATPAIILFIAGCNQAQQPAQQVSSQNKHIAASAKPSQAERDRLAQALHDQNPPPKIPSTARTIEPFRQLKPGMTRREVISKVGMPDKDVGSGLFVDIYKLSDGSVVTLGSGGNLIYAHHKPKQGKEYELLKSKSQPQ